MTLRGKFGLSRFLLNHQDKIFYFYMVDVPLFSTQKLVGIKPEDIDRINKYHILVKGLIVMVMTMESLMSHTFGPGPKKPKEHVHSEACGC